MSVDCQFKIRYIVIYYYGHILINKNNTLHRKRGYSKWRHQYKTNSSRIRFCPEKIFVWLFVIHPYYIKDKKLFKATRAKISLFWICNINKRQKVCVVKTFCACIRCFHYLINSYVFYIHVNIIFIYNQFLYILEKR